MYRLSCSIQSNLLARISYTVCEEFQLEILSLSSEGSTKETMHVKFLSKTLSGHTCMLIVSFCFIMSTQLRLLRQG